MSKLDRFKNMNQKQQLGLGVVVVALMAAVYSYWPHIKPLPSVAGVYYTKNELDLSTLTITDKDTGGITCVWDKMVMDNKGNIRENKITLEGTAKGKDISLGTTIQGAQPIVVTGAGLREEKEIRLSLSSDGRVFYTGQYEPTDMLGLAAITSEYKRKSSELTEAWNRKLQLRVTGGKTPADQALVRRKLVDQGNLYTHKIADFVNAHTTVENDFKGYTLQMKQYLDNVHRIPGPQNAMMRKQMLVMMHNIQELTRNLQDKQDSFKSDYVKQVVPYFDSLSSQQKVCANAKALGKSDPREEELCAIAYQMQTNLMNQAKGLKEAMREVTTTFAAEEKAQQRMIDEAQQVQ